MAGTAMTGDSGESREQLANVRTTATETGRVNQKLRTRQALIAAAKELIDGGATPTLAEVADHALVSKTTAYRYFASAEDLIAEVFFDREFPTVATTFASVGDDPTDRLLAVEAAITNALLANELAMRMIIRNSLDVSLTGTDDSPPRIGRRRVLIAEALADLESELGSDELQQLKCALALVIGPEAILAARDVCGLSPDETRDVTRWAASALLTYAREHGSSALGGVRPSVDVVDGD
jgi:AcrR family transcriptional regulator